MNCADAEAAIAGGLDGELDQVRQRALNAHLAGCPTCEAELASLNDLKARVTESVAYYRAPAALRQDVTRMLDDADAAAGRQRSVGSMASRWFNGKANRRVFVAGALSGAATLAVGWIGATAWFEHRHDAGLAQLLVDAHVRATLGDHLISVASSDQHTVKPWLSARLDYAPPVIETPIADVTLAGARIESIDGQRMATLVYRYRAHTIDVFVWPIGQALSAGSAATIRGFNIAESSGADMQWRAVSDASRQILRALVEALAQAAAR